VGFVYRAWENPFSILIAFRRADLPNLILKKGLRKIPFFNEPTLSSRLETWDSFLA
jgi:hypothetical protein